MSQDVEKTVDDMTNEELIERLVEVESEKLQLKNKAQRAEDDLKSVREAWRSINLALGATFTPAQETEIEEIVEREVDSKVDDRIRNLTVEVY